MRKLMFKIGIGLIKLSGYNSTPATVSLIHLFGDYNKNKISSLDAAKITVKEYIIIKNWKYDV